MAATPSDNSSDLTESLARGLGALEPRLADLGLYSKSVKNRDCPGPLAGVCRCGEALCIPAVVVTPVPAERVATAVRAVWPDIEDDPTWLSLAPESVTNLNARLRGAAGLPADATFIDKSFCGRWPGAGDVDVSWSTLVSELSDGGDDEAWAEELGTYIVCQLAWGGHVPALGLTTGWLLASGLRLASGLDVFAPDPTRADQFLAALDGARPGVWDTESVRGMWPDRC